MTIEEEQDRKTILQMQARILKLEEEVEKLKGKTIIYLTEREDVKEAV